MKLLLDENLSRRLLPLIDPHFAGSMHVCLAGLERASDPEVWSFAKANGLVVVTCDSDFHEMSLLRGAPPHVIWLHGGNLSTPAAAEKLISAKAELQYAFGERGASFVELL